MTLGARHIGEAVQNQLILDGLRWLGASGKATSVGDGAQTPQTRPTTGVVLRRAPVLAERGGQHGPFVDAASTWLNGFAVQHRFEVDYVEDTRTITAASLERYQLFIQLNYPPYGWTQQIP